MKMLKVAAIGGVLLTQSGCVELLLLGMELTTAGLMTTAYVQDQEKKRLEKQAEPVVVEAKATEVQNGDYGTVTTATISTP